MYLSGVDGVIEELYKEGSNDSVASRGGRRWRKEEQKGKEGSR